jgi:hypothetical protein
MLNRIRLNSTLVQAFQVVHNMPQWLELLVLLADHVKTLARTEAHEPQRVDRL